MSSFCRCSSRWLWKFHNFEVVGKRNLRVEGRWGGRGTSDSGKRGQGRGKRCITLKFDVSCGILAYIFSKKYNFWINKILNIFYFRFFANLGILKNYSPFTFYITYSSNTVKPRNKEPSTSRIFFKLKNDFSKNVATYLKL